MKKNEIVVGGLYTAKISNKLTTVKVRIIDSMTIRGRERTVYFVTNLTTGREVTFRSAAKFRGLAKKPNPVKSSLHDTEHYQMLNDHDKAMIDSLTDTLHPEGI